MKSLSSEDRALIDAAIAEGRVTRCSTGESAHCGYVWSDTHNALIARDPEQQGWRGSFARGGADAARRARLMNPRVTARRAQVAELAARMTVAQIAAELGISSDTVRNDLCKKRVSAQPAPVLQRGVSQQVEARRRKIKTHWTPQVTYRALSEATGVDYNLVRADCRAMGLEVAAVKGWVHGPSGVRRARMATMAATHTHAELCSFFGVTAATVWNDLRKLGIKCKSSVPPASKGRRSRQAKIRRIYEAAGALPTVDILAAQFGVQETAIYRDLRALELPTPVVGCAAVVPAREQVAAVFRPGMTRGEIMATTGLSRSTVCHVVRSEGLAVREVARRGAAAPDGRRDAA